LSVYKLFGSGTGGAENSIASLDIQFDGLIRAIHGALIADLDADGEYCWSEASFLSSNTVSVNDSRGSLIILGVQTSNTVNVISANSGIGGLAIAVSSGERVHLHANATAGVTSTAQIYIYVEDGAAVNLRRRR